MLQGQNPKSRRHWHQTVVQGKDQKPLVPLRELFRRNLQSEKVNETLGSIAQRCLPSNHRVHPTHSTKSVSAEVKDSLCVDWPPSFSLLQRLPPQAKAVKNTMP